MLRAIPALLLALAALPLAAPTASAWTCAVSENPLPPAPVGGQVGAIYTHESNFAWATFTWSVYTTCGAAAFAVWAINEHCTFYLGGECISVA